MYDYVDKSNYIMMKYFLINTYDILHDVMKGTKVQTPGVNAVAGAWLGCTGWLIGQ